MESLERKDTTAGTEELVKSEGLVDPSPVTNDRSNGGVSPPPHCSICLGGLVNTSFTDSCLHQFCFTCLLQWAKIKTECPLCKQTFKSIIHNVRSEGDYDQYHVPYTTQVTATAATLDVTADIHVNEWDIPPRPFMYRTTNWGRRFGVMLSNAEAVTRGEQVSSIASTEERRHRIAHPMDFRRRVYREGLWACPLADGFRRFRDSSPLFYRLHPEEIERLVPWLNRELQVVLNNHHILYVLNRITDSLTRMYINSVEFRVLIRPYLRHYTKHFQHEFYNFARSNFDLVGYDFAVTYSLHRNITSPDTTSSSSSSSDSEVRVIDHISDPRNSLDLSTHFVNTLGPNSFLPAFRNIEPDVVTVSSASSESEGECEVVGVVKPRHERTPEIIDLSSEEEDKLEVVNTDQPSTSQGNSQSELVSQEDDLNLPSTSSAGSYLSNSSSKRTRRCVEDSTKSLYDYIDSSSDSYSDKRDSDYNPSSKCKSRRNHKSNSKKSSKSSRKLCSRTKSAGSSHSKKQKSSLTHNQSDSYSCEENDTRDMSSRRNRKRYRNLSDSDSEYEKTTKKSKKSKKSKNASQTREVTHERGSTRYSSNCESDYAMSRKKVKKSKKSKSSRASKRCCVLIQTSKIPKARIYKLNKLSSSDDDCSTSDSSSCSESDNKKESKNKSCKRVKRKSTSSSSSSNKNLPEDHSFKEDSNKPSHSKNIRTIKKTYSQSTDDFDHSNDRKSLNHSLNHLSDNGCLSDNQNHSSSNSKMDDYTPLHEALESNKSTKESNQPLSTCQSCESSQAAIPSTSKCDSPSKHSELPSTSKTNNDVWQSHYQECKESKTQKRPHS